MRKMLNLRSFGWTARSTGRPVSVPCKIWIKATEKLPYTHVKDQPEINEIGFDKVFCKKKSL